MCYPFHPSGPCLQMNNVSTVSSHSGYKEFGLTVTTDLPIENNRKFEIRVLSDTGIMFVIYNSKELLKIL
jgi:hypothetical protein